MHTRAHGEHAKADSGGKLPSGQFTGSILETAVCNKVANLLHSKRHVPPVQCRGRRWLVWRACASQFIKYTSREGEMISPFSLQTLPTESVSELDNCLLRRSITLVVRRTQGQSLAY